MNKIVLLLTLSFVFCSQWWTVHAQRRSLLYANPENPGPTPLATVRQQMLERFDRNDDSFLDRDERNTMRLESKRDAEDRMKAVLSARKRREENDRPPERWLALYDKNKDKRFDGGEWEIARATEVARVTQQFDKNSDKQLSQEERKAVAQFMRSKKHHGYDHYILRLVSGEEERRRDQSRSPEERWHRFDADGNGIASREELAAIRKRLRACLKKQTI